MERARRWAWVQWALPLARLAIFQGKLDADDLVAMLIDGRGPTGTVSSSRAAHFLSVPIHRETGSVKAWLLFRLPLVISSGWGDQINPILLATLHKLLGFGVIRVSQVLVFATSPCPLSLDGSLGSRPHRHFPPGSFRHA